MNVRITNDCPDLACTCNCCPREHRFFMGYQPSVNGPRVFCNLIPDHWHRVCLMVSSESTWRFNLGTETELTAHYFIPGSNSPPTTYKEQIMARRKQKKATTICSAFVIEGLSLVIFIFLFVQARAERQKESRLEKASFPVIQEMFQQTPFQELVGRRS